MIDIVLLAVISALVTLVAYKDKVAKEERDKLVNALLAKNAQELRDLQIADKVKVEPTQPEKPDLIPTDTLTDEEWEQKIANDIK